MVQVGAPNRNQHIFNKGDPLETNKEETTWGNNDINGMAFPNNGPGLYLSQKKNSLIVVMNSFNDVMEEVEIDDIPLNKWINVVLRCSR